MILDAMRALFKEGKAGTASVSDIAKKAGIAKGGMYYPVLLSKAMALHRFYIEHFSS